MRRLLHLRSSHNVHTIWGWVWTSTPLLLNPPACFLPANRWDAWCYRLQMLVSRKSVCCVLRKWYCRQTVGIHWMAQQFTKFIKVNVSSRLPLLQLSGFSPGWNSVSDVGGWLRSTSVRNHSTSYNASSLVGCPCRQYVYTRIYHILCMYTNRWLKT